MVSVDTDQCLAAVYSAWRYTTYFNNWLLTSYIVAHQVTLFVADDNTLLIDYHRACLSKVQSASLLACMFQSNDLAVAAYHCGLVEVGGNSCLIHQLQKYIHFSSHFVWYIATELLSLR